MSKKILSIALAVVMLFSVCAFSVSAALSAGQVGIILETNAKANMGAGEEVWVKVYFDVPSTEGYLHGNSNVVLAFTDGFALATESATDTACYDAREWGASYAEYFKETSTVSIKSTVYNSVSGKFTANDSAKNWTGAVMVQQATNTDNGYSTTSGYPIDPSCEVFTLYFTTTRALTANDSIGVPEASVTMGQTLMKYISGTSAKTYAKSLDTIVVNEAVIYPEAAPSYDVYNLGGKNGETAVKKSNGNGTYNIGTFFAFKVATIDPAFNEKGTSVNITGITATITANLAAGGTSTVTPDPINKVYDVSAAQDRSELGFIVAINNIPDAAAEVTSYTITPVMTTADGNTYTCETITVNVADLA